MGLRTLTVLLVLLLAAPAVMAGGKVKTWKDPYLHMEFVWIPGGCFQMGCNKGDKECYFDEKPLHKVCLKGFWMSRRPVTVEEWQRFVKETHYTPKKKDLWGGCLDIGKPSFKQGPDHPVVCVSWYDAQAFAQWLSQKTGYKFTLPTEAQWEYACKDGARELKYPWGEGTPINKANFWSGPGGVAQKDRWKYTSPVEAFPPGASGLYDMAGNVWEWCQDWYNSFYYKSSPQDNPQGPKRTEETKAELKFKAIRGACWSDQPKRLRCSQRASLDPHQAFGSVGFRLVREE